MFFSNTVTAFSLLGLSAAAPALVQRQTSCTSPLRPDIQMGLLQGAPDASEKIDDGFFQVSQLVRPGNAVFNRTNELLTFDSIPAGATGCQLYFNSSSDFLIHSTYPATLDVRTVGHDASDTPHYTQEATGYSWNSFYYTDAAPKDIVGTDLFGTITISGGQEIVVNSRDCPVGGGSLAFVFSVSESDPTDSYTSVSYNIGSDDDAETTGFFLSYELEGC